MDQAVAQEQPGGRGAGRRVAVPESSAEPDRLVLHIPAAVDRLRALRRRVGRWAEGHGLDEGAVIDLQLALGEAVSNCMEHAYRDGATGTVDVELEIRAGGRGRELAVRVGDRGRWKPATSRPSHRGRGLAMIDRLSEGMRVTSNGTGTDVTFVVVLDAR